MKKKILIIGGTGFLGSHLSKELCTKYSITSISLKKKITKKINGVEYKNLDITKKRQFKFLDRKTFDIVINFGGYVDHNNKTLNLKTQYIAVKNLVEYFENKNLECLIQIGSCAEYGSVDSPHLENFHCKPKMAYGKAKLKATKYLKSLTEHKKIPIIILRLYQIYGPKQSSNRFIPILINKCLENKKFLCHTKDIYRDFLYIDDFIELLKKIIVSKKKKKCFGKIFNVGFGKPINLKLISEKIKKLSGGGHQSSKVVKLRIDENKVIYPNIELIKTFFNWYPKIKIDTGLKKTVNFYKNSKLF